MKVLIIGAGNMGMTYGQSFINSSILDRSDLYVLERNQEKAAHIQAISSHEQEADAGEFIRDMDLIILSVKPQDFTALAKAIRPYLRPDHLIMSIMAGIKISGIERELGLKKIVRAMPNLPAQVGLGMTVFSTSIEVSRLEIFTVQNLLNTTGKTLYVENEELIDSATAISGSGPAYVFYFMESMMNTAKSMGFSDAEAQLLVKQTFLGSINLLNKNSLSCADWIRKVSSKGGTTEAAVKEFNSQHLEDKIKSGLDAAERRAQELSLG
ncbi:MAG: pyrroline-5-carboxylate reductase [Bacteroidota bacterium]